MIKLHDAVRTLRKQLGGISQHSLALKLGVQTAMISHWETKVQRVSHKNLWKMAKLARGPLVWDFLEADGMSIGQMRDVIQRAKRKVTS